MNDRNKQELIATILVDRLSYVMRGEAELFIGKFEVDFFQIKHVYDKATALEFWKTYDYQANGGMTDMGKVVRHIKDEIDSKNFLGLGIDLSEERTELLLINDGQLA